MVNTSDVFQEPFSKHSQNPPQKSLNTPSRLAEEKIEEIEKGPEDKAEKNPPSSPQPKAKGKRSEPKASPRASRGSRKAETKSDKSPPKTGNLDLFSNNERPNWKGSHNQILRGEQVTMVIKQLLGFVFVGDFF